MRRWFIAGALLANALASGLVLLLLLYGTGWGEPVRLSATEAGLLVVVAAAAFVLNLLLAPVLGFRTWARERELRRLERRLAVAETSRAGEPSGAAAPPAAVEERADGDDEA